MTTFMKFLHVITAFWFIGGLFGRTIIMWQASKMADVQMVGMLVKVGGYFERFMVIPGSLAVLGFGLVTAWLQRWPLLGSLQGSPSNWLLLSTVIYLTLIPIIALVFLPRGKIFGKALAEALSLGTVTEPLQAAFHDRAVGIAHVYEWVTTVVIIYLMVAKPF
jgi:uncharacterized membrane protein